MLEHSHQRGDTIIEVLFAITVFSLVAVGTFSIMNQGASASQRALEVNLVRQQIDEQAEVLRFVHDAYLSANTTEPAAGTPAGEWAQLVARAESESAEAFGVTNSSCPTPPDDAFIMNGQVAAVVADRSALQPAETNAQVLYQNGTTVAQGLWIEAARWEPPSGSADTNAGYIDFHIRACWAAPGTPEPMTTGTIVRLYEPRI